MSYSRRTVTDGVTVMNKDLYDNLQDGIDELKEESSCKNNPVFTGSLSMNRTEGSTIGENSVALGNDNVSSNNSFAIGQKCVSGSYIKYDTTVTPEIENNNTIHYFKISDLSNNISVNDEIILVGFNNTTGDVSMFKSNILSISETTDSENNTFYKLKIDESKINFDDYWYGFVFIFDTSKENIMSSYAEGYFTSSNGMFSHSEGYGTTASGNISHAEGSMATASGASSHAEGSMAIASGAYSHSEGYSTIAIGASSHSEGYSTTASGDSSHSEGSNTTASGAFSHAEGVETKAYSDYQHVQGKYNIEDTSGTYAHIVGGGIDDSNRKNIHTLDWEGNAVFSGDVVATKSDGTEVSLLEDRIKGFINNSEININSITMDSNVDNFTSNHYECGELPYDFYYGSAVVLNNEIHLLGGAGKNTGHYKFNSSTSTWEEVSTLPYSLSSGSAVVLNNEIHIMGGTNNETRHYKYNGSTWTSVSTLPYSFKSGSAVVYKDEIHLLGGSSNDSTYTKHYKFDGSTWTKLNDLPYSFKSGSAVVYKDEIHIMSMVSDKSFHLKFNGSEWVEDIAVPYLLNNGSAVVYNDEIYTLGSFVDGNTSNYCRFINSKWCDVKQLPYSFSYGSAVVYKDEIHLLGGYNSSRKHRVFVVPSVVLRDINLGNNLDVSVKQPPTNSTNTDTNTNIVSSTEDLISGVSKLETGTLYVVYEE